MERFLLHVEPPNSCGLSHSIILERTAVIPRSLSWPEPFDNSRTNGCDDEKGLEKSLSSIAPRAIYMRLVSPHSSAAFSLGRRRRPLCPSLFLRTGSSFSGEAVPYETDTSCPACYLSRSRRPFVDLQIHDLK
ncbi:unnamed protein product [Victoria cruziana]